MMNEAGLCATRVNGELLRRFVNTNVCLVGKVDHWTTSTLKLVTSDGKNVECQIAASRCQPMNIQFVMVTGKAVGDSTVVLNNPSTHFIVPLGNDLDLSIADKVTMLMHHPQVRDIFEVCKIDSA
eukprot:Protomagalhaensia_sp_Gyna_25__689@NODE_1321_length_1946_cov_618_711064_g1015_i1_p2_GENE_NODE_1321_length_1946_cov_618_711064_g1015_i1NODE_1321_length_1946_cov_618_711064_g1015_i1_p2_ORF_typecomplete_len125_score11_62Rep_facA_3/PF08661_11/7_9e17_NODE_1321_length_1946_cov_618_711064_g1015_i185459